MAELTVNGATLSYDDRGAGAPAFVFIHGWACDRTCWSAQVEEFSKDHRCIAVDLRGRGESSPVPPFRVGQALEDVAAVIRELGVAPAILVGHSLGGIIALALNGRYPDLTLGVVTIDSPITAETGAGSPRSVSLIREAGSMRAVEGFIRSFAYDPPHPAALDYHERVILTCPADVGAGMLEDLHLVGQDIQVLGHFHGDLQLAVVLHRVDAGGHHAAQVHRRQRDMVGARVVEKLVDGGIELDDVRHHVFARDFVGYAHFCLQSQACQGRAQIVRNAGEHDRAVLLQLGKLLRHAVEADVHLANLAGHSLFVESAGSKVAVAHAVGGKRQAFERLVDQPGNRRRPGERQDAGGHQPDQPGAPTRRCEARAIHQ